MIGINNQNGKALAGIAHLRQSIRDILLTPLGTRVMRRDYGSRLFELIDAPLNSATIIDIVAATAEALDRWEPRFKIERVILDDSAGNDDRPVTFRLGNGQVGLTLYGKYLPDGQPIKLNGLIL